MGLLTLEHSRAAYRADFALYGLAVVALSVMLLRYGPPARVASLGALVVVGLAAWTLAEYTVHRFVLHGLEPFRRWHAEHHRRPRALVYTPTVISAAAIALYVTVPSWWLADRWAACALTLGVTAGCLGYSATHHAVHQALSRGAWLQRRRRWHALHHRAGLGLKPGRYGVTSGLWDHVFGTVSPHAR